MVSIIIEVLAIIKVLNSIILIDDLPFSLKIAIIEVRATLELIASIPYICIFVVFYILFFILLITCLRKASRKKILHCNKCGCVTLVQMSKTILSKEPVSKVEKQSVRDKAGNVVGTYEQRVYGERQTIEYIYKCSNCGKLCKKEEHVNRWF